MQQNRSIRARAALLSLVFSVSFTALACTPPEPKPTIDTTSEAKPPTIPTAKKVDTVPRK